MWVYVHNHTVYHEFIRQLEQPYWSRSSFTIQVELNILQTIYKSDPVSVEYWEFYKVKRWRELMREGPPRLIVTQMLLDASTTFLMLLWQTLLTEPLQLVWKMFLEPSDPFVCLKNPPRNKIHMLFLLSLIVMYRIIYMKITLPQLGKRIQMNVGCRWETLSGDAPLTMNRIPSLRFSNNSYSVFSVVYFLGLELKAMPRIEAY